MNFEEDDFEGVSFLMPTESSSNLIHSVTSQSRAQNELEIKSRHDFLMENEKRHVAIQLRSKSPFELLRLEEELLRYHSACVLKEVDEAHCLASQYLSEILDSGSRNSQKSYSISAVFGESHSTAPEAAIYSILFPWQQLDRNVEQSCCTLLRESNFDGCRAYLIGYLECIARLPEHDQTPQGKIFNSSKGWLIGRHPFGYVFSVFQSAMNILLHRLAAGITCSSVICSKIKDFVGLSREAWLLSWPLAVEEGAKGGFPFEELLLEALQHVLFMALPPQLPRVLFTPPPEGGGQKQASLSCKETVSRSESCKDIGSAVSREPSFSRKGARAGEEVGLTGFSSQMRCGGFVGGASGAGASAFTPPIWSTLRSLLEKCGVSGRIGQAMLRCDSPAPPTSLSAHHQLDEASNPLASACRELAVLEVARTPLEVATVLLALSDNVVKTTTAIISAQDRGMPYFQPHPKPCEVPVSPRPTDEDKPFSPPIQIGADELLPLICFCFAVRYGGGGSFTATAGVATPTLTEVMLSLRFAAEFLPSHLEARREGYIIATTITATSVIWSKEGRS